MFCHSAFAIPGTSMISKQSGTGSHFRKRGQIEFLKSAPFFYYPLSIFNFIIQDVKRSDLAKDRETIRDRALLFEGRKVIRGALLTY